MMFTNLGALILPFLLVPLVNGHSVPIRLRVNDKELGLMEGIYPAPDGPVVNVMSNDLTCNKGFKRPKKKVEMDAGEKAAIQWGHGQKGPSSPNDKDNPISISHLGPSMIYLAKIDGDEDKDGKDDDDKPQDLKWFKIFHDGYHNGKWSVERLYYGGGWVNFTIPECITNGDYYLRAEIIGLQSAKQDKGAQLYMSCAWIEIKGGKGPEVPDDKTVKIPGVYKADDPGIKIDIYNKKNIEKYDIPGPEPLECVGVAGRVRMSK